MNILCDHATADFACDLFVCADGDEWVIHVQRTRYATEAPHSLPVCLIPTDGPLRTAALDAWTAAVLAQMAWLAATPMVPIGLPHDGAMFREATAAGALQRMTQLLSDGYRIPPTIMERMRWQAHGYAMLSRAA